MGIIKLKKNEGRQEVVESEILEKAKECNLTTKGKAEEVLPSWDDPAILREDNSKANAHTCHYVLNNGTTKSVITAKESNYFDEETQKWKEIDNTFVEKEDEFECVCGDVKKQIAKSNKGKSVSVSKKDKKVSWEFLGKQTDNGNKLQSTAKETTLKVEKDKTKKKSKSSRAVYENVESGTDLEYFFEGNNVKENIIVKEKSDSYKYLFELKTDGLKMRLSKDNKCIELYSEDKTENGENKEQVEFIVPNPYMYDANGNRSDDVSYEIEKSNKNGVHTFAVIASEEWINAKERVFPVTIDPQLIIDSSSILTYQVFSRSVINDGTGNSFTEWATASNVYNLKVSKDSTSEYKTVIQVNKAYMNLSGNRILTSKLILFPKYGGILSSANIVKNGEVIYYSSQNGNLEIDVTNEMKVDFGNFSIELAPSTDYCNFEFQDYTKNKPFLEIEYLTNDFTIPTKKTISLAGIVSSEINLATGDMISKFTDVKAENSVGGLEIRHVNKKSSEDFYLGDDYRLNLHETFIKNGNSLLDADYIYTDEDGDKHSFKDYYYKFENGQKTYLTVDKSAISIDGNGMLKYNGDTIYQEYKSATGLKAMTTLDSFKFASLLEQRNDEFKQVEDSVFNYKKALEDFVSLNRETGEITQRLKDNFSSIKSYEDFISYVNNAIKQWKRKR